MARLNGGIIPRCARSCRIRNDGNLRLCGRCHYRLERQGPGDGSKLVVMVNLFTAGTPQGHATIRKLLGYDCVIMPWRTPA